MACVVSSVHLCQEAQKTARAHGVMFAGKGGNSGRSSNGELVHAAAAARLARCSGPHMFKLLCRPAGILASLTRAASKKAAGSGGVSRTSNPSYLGVKIFGDQFAKAGATVVRQRGVRYSPGENMGLARDDKLFALKSGYVEFQKVFLPKKRHLVHIRERTPEEHLAFVRGKKPAREAAARLKPSPHAKLQMGLFAHRGEPKRTQPEASSSVSG